MKFEAGLYKGDTKMEEGTIEGGAYTVKVGFVDQLSGNILKAPSFLENRSIQSASMERRRN